MRIKLDENLPRSLVEPLRSNGHDVDTVPDEGLAGRPDADVWSRAQAEGRFLITQDLDFGVLSRLMPEHAGVLLVRLRKPGRAALTARVARIFASEDIESWTGCFVVATEVKVRVRRPARR